MTDKSKQDGGPAFPFSTHMSGAYIPGMSLRQWYAGMALIGYMARGWENLPMNFTKDHVARECLEQADAMIARSNEGDE